MSKSNNQPSGDSSGKASDSKSPKTHHSPPQGYGRETFESIAFAFVLALFFRTFVAEAFVIPTGSMAPTLYGRNKDVVCSGCGFKYAIGASDELDDASGFLIPGRRIDQSMCPNCRHMQSVKSVSAFTGDRILVNKSAFQFGEPDRWDVIVFRYPEDSQKNYIKRLVGLPGETIRVERGDVYAKTGTTGEFHILRKQDPNKQKLLQQVVYDDNHPPTELLKNGWPEAWQPRIHSNDTSAPAGWETDVDGWKHDPNARKFDLAASDDIRWIRYQHLVPTLVEWGAAEDGKAVSGDPRPQLISDLCGYNAYTGGHASGLEDDRYWVGDLTLTCTVNIKSVASQPILTLELNEGVRRYRCQIDVATGTARLTQNDDLAPDPNNAGEIELATARTAINGPGTYRLRFANVDDRLCLWVNDNWMNSGLVSFGEGAKYNAPGNQRPQDADLVPAGVAARGLDISVSGLLIERDIYYRAERSDFGHDYEVDPHIQLREALSKPTEWGDLYEKHKHAAEFSELGSDEFFVMGDNSPRSQDSRLWPNDVRRAKNRHAVPGTALIGKAFFIYWPHAVPFLNGGRGFNVWPHEIARRDGNIEDQKEAHSYPKYSFPFYPQWWRWKRIR